MRNDSPYCGFRINIKIDKNLSHINAAFTEIDK